MTAPIASGWSESPGGPCTHWKAPPCHGARREQPLLASWMTGTLPGCGPARIRSVGLLSASRPSGTGPASPPPPSPQWHRCEKYRSLDMLAGSGQVGRSLGRARTKANRKTTMARLAGRKIIITGGASSIGRATARLFRREGAAVAILDRSDNAAKAVANEIGAVALACDVSDPASVSAAVNKAAEALGGL